MNKIWVMLLAFFSLWSCIKLRNSQMSIRIQTELENKLNSLNNLQSEQSYIQLSGIFEHKYHNLTNVITLWSEKDLNEFIKNIKLFSLS